MGLTLNYFLNGFELKEVQNSGDNFCSGMLKWDLEVPKIQIVDLIQGLLLPSIYMPLFLEPCTQWLESNT